jgi:hypothetical protein
MINFKRVQFWNAQIFRTFFDDSPYFFVQKLYDGVIKSGLESWCQNSS